MTIAFLLLCIAQLAVLMPVLRRSYRHRQQLQLQTETLHKKLEEQTAALKRTEEDLEQIAYIVSHDLKAPVRNIASFMKMIIARNKDSFKPDVLEFMQHTSDSAAQLSNQIDALISYCRIDRNLPPAAGVDLEQMLSTIKMELAAKTSISNALITFPAQFPVVEGVHSSLLHQVFKHLIENALKFNTSARPQVGINWKEENGMLTFSVADNGIGIAPQYGSKLFQMFKRLHGTEQYGGNGTGLAICRKIVNFYGGKIWFESEPEKGSTFYFTLPKMNEEKAVVSAAAEIPLPQPVLKAA